MENQPQRSKRIESHSLRNYVEFGGVVGSGSLVFGSDGVFEVSPKFAEGLQPELRLLGQCRRWGLAEVEVDASEVVVDAVEGRSGLTRDRVLRVVTHLWKGRQRR